MCKYVKNSFGSQKPFMVSRRKPLPCWISLSGLRLLWGSVRTPVSSVLGDSASQTHLPAVVTAGGPACSYQPASPSRRTGLWWEGTRDRKPCWSLGCPALRSVTTTHAVLSGLELVGVEGWKSTCGWAPAGPVPGSLREGLAGAPSRGWGAFMSF